METVRELSNVVARLRPRACRDTRSGLAAPSRIPRSALLAAPIVALGIGALVVALAGEQAGEVVQERQGDAPLAHPELDAGLAIAAAPHDAGAALDPDRLAPDGAILAPPEGTDYQCLQPALPIVRDPACDRGEPYPACRWQLPDTPDARGLYRVWRNTTPEHRWARPGLVSLVTAAAREYARRWPGEQMTIGDLDAAGPRHQTHDRGVDVDMYLEHAMIATNIGGGHYLETYEGLPPRVVRLLRARVLDLARILATCSRGRLRVYYNDPEIVDALRAWFDAQGLVSDVGRPMQQHNPLHRFHFHMTVAEDLPTLPVEGE